jgi:polyferredoxin
VPLSAAAKVKPVPDTVLNSTVKAPVVPLIIIYVFSIVSGTVTTWLPVMVPVNLITAFRPLDRVPSVTAKVVV